MRDIRDLFALIIAATLFVVILLLFSLNDVQANEPNVWPCNPPGWDPGTQWGPGADDVVPSEAPCASGYTDPYVASPPVSANAPAPALATPRPTPIVVGLPRPTPTPTLPPTDTAP